EGEGENEGNAAGNRLHLPPHPLHPVILAPVRPEEQRRQAQVHVARARHQASVVALLALPAPASPPARSLRQGRALFHPPSFPRARAYRASRHCVPQDPHLQLHISGAHFPTELRRRSSSQIPGSRGPTVVPSTLMPEKWGDAVRSVVFPAGLRLVIAEEVKVAAATGCPPPYHAVHYQSSDELSVAAV
ncbi:hypothetical protein C8R45DRAFT_1031480, partial [Mycena sanguinolenta]